ncbi:LppU family putative lipoprotein [Rhodococcoides kyotonense]|nr:hypothetical protein [Rhodococcus kyotonensis]
MHSSSPRSSWGSVLSKVTAGIALVLLAASCSSETSGEAAPATSATVVTTVAGQQGADDGGSTDIDVEIGDCVKLGGTMSDAEIEEAACGSPESNYKVIAKAEQNASCVSDADQVYYETYGGTEQGALCLDVDWVVDGCMSIPSGMDEPARVDCADPAATNVERVTKIVEGAVDVEQCEEGGYSYPERQFTVCTETVTV